MKNIVLEFVNAYQLLEKGYLIDHLKMSATPIPRTLALSFLGDSDISILKTLPGNRKETITEYIEYQNRHKSFEHIAEQVKQGRQVYIITPMIEDSESMDLSNALEVYENTKKYYRGIAEVGLIHGRLKAEEKQEIMEKFARNEIQILVATSVIEVGVNVVNATNITAFLMLTALGLLNYIKCVDEFVGAIINHIVS